MIYIWIRQTTDWADEGAFNAQLDPPFAPKVETWNRTFTLPFHVFRHRVREVARANLERVEDAVIAPWSDIPEGALVLPVDDDDWFAPDIAAALAVAGPAPGFHWIQSVLEVPIDFGHRLALFKRSLLKSPPRWLCSTNSYALPKCADAAEALRRRCGGTPWPANGVPTIPG